MTTVWSSSKRAIVTSILIVAAVAAGLLVGAMSRPSTQAAPTPNVCADTSGKGGSAGTNTTGVTENTTPVTTTETPASTSTTTNTTNNHTHNEHGLVNVNDVTVKDVVDVNNNSILNENTVKILNDVLSVGDVTATVNSTVKTVTDVL